MEMVLSLAYPYVASQIMSLFFGGAEHAPQPFERIVVALFAFSVSAGALVYICDKALSGNCFRFGCIAATVAFFFFYVAHPQLSFTEILSATAADGPSLVTMLFVVTIPITFGVLGRVTLQKEGAG